MRKYKYNGTMKVSLGMIGDVEPGKTFETDQRIHHPDFEEVKHEERREKLKKGEPVKK